MRDEINGENPPPGRIPEVLRKYPVPENLDRPDLVAVKVGRIFVIFEESPVRQN
jgi:hypothetical protein